MWGGALCLHQSSHDEKLLKHLDKRRAILLEEQKKKKAATASAKRKATAAATAAKVVLASGANCCVGWYPLRVCTSLPDSALKGTSQPSGCLFSIGRTHEFVGCFQC